MRGKVLLVLVAVAVALTGFLVAQTTINGTRTINGDLTVKGTCTGCGTSGALVLLEQHTASTSSELDFTTCISSTYEEYQIELNGLLVGTAAADINFQVHLGSGYDTGNNYNWTLGSWTSGSGFGNSGGNGVAIITLFHSSGTTTSWTANGTFIFHNISGSFPVLTGQAAGRNSVNNALQEDVVSGMYLTTTAVDGFRVLPSSGTLTSGNVRCYGLSK